MLINQVFFAICLGYVGMIVTYLHCLGSNTTFWIPLWHALLKKSLGTLLGFTNPAIFSGNSHGTIGEDRGCSVAMFKRHRKVFITMVVANISI